MTFRVEKNTNYTIMCNHHLQNRKLTLKAKGLLSIMLSLPENWDYSLKGLATICTEGVDSIRSALNELEAEGYIKRNKIRKPSGQWGSEYVIYETPHHEEAPSSENANTLSDFKEPATAHEVLPGVTENPDNITNKTAACNAKTTTLENPTRSNSTTLDNPTRFSQHGSTTLDYPTQLNTNNKILNNNIHISNPSNLSNNTDITENAVDVTICEQIDYDSLIAEHPEDADVIDGIVDIMCQYSSLSDNAKPVYVGGFPQSSLAIKKRLKKLTKDHIASVLTGIKQSNKPVRHYKAYILASLLNAPCSLNAGNIRTGSPVDKPATNRFHNFEQRDVDYEDMKLDISQY